MSQVSKSEPVEEKVTSAAVGQPGAQSPDLAEAHRLLLEWNQSARQFSNKDLCLHQLIEEQCVRTPNNTALAFEQESMTYGELSLRSTRLAQHLQSMGAGPDVIVGLFVERSLNVLVGILGILKSGAAYVPIDAAYPRERVEYILSDSRASILLTQSRLQKGLASDLMPTVCLDTFDWDSQETGTPLREQARPENLAYVIYTSGSTGRPKGVGIEHRNIVNYVLGVSERLELKPGMKFAMVSTIAADLGNTVLFPPLITGGSLHIISQERVESQALLADYFTRENIDVLKIVPSHLAALQTGRHPERVMPKHRLVLGGEASRLEWIQQLRSLVPGCEIFNHYGPTETTVGVLTYHANGQLPSTQSGSLPLGRPLPNSRVYVLDENRQPVPVGIQGELYIGGAGVARGYLNRPDLNAEKFVPDPYSDDPDGRMYRTGDLARHLPDGSIEFGGRIDHQVKIHGYRIELGEIEGALREHAGVREALVVACDDEAGNKHLVAYLVPREAQQQTLWSCKSLYTLPDGSPISHLSKGETDRQYNETFVQKLHFQHGVSLQDGACVVDASANIGLFVLYACQQASNLRLIALEKNAAAFDCLKANTSAWKVPAKCLPVTLGREQRSSEYEFFSALSSGLGDIDRGGGEEIFRLQGGSRDRAETGSSSPFGIGSESGATQSRSITSIIEDEGIECIDLLRIRCDDDDLGILQDLSDEDWSKVRQVVLEVDGNQDLQPVRSLLNQHGLEFETEQGSKRSASRSYVYGVRPASRGGRAKVELPADARAHETSHVSESLLTPMGLRKYLRDRLPQYMVPAAFVLLEKFPLTANGKIDRGALPAYTPEVTRSAKEFVKPRTETEQKLASIWAGLLKMDNLSIHDDFFELGGHSLMAIKLVSQIRDAFGVDLPLATLLHASTIADLAKLVSKAEFTPTWPTLVPIKPRGSKPPLYLFHAHGGNVLEYQALASLLDPERPVYAFQAKGLDGQIQKGVSLEEMAATYLRDLREFQPEGPYQLGGFCLGGLLALEMAQQLKAMGEDVPTLVVIQSIHPDAREFKPNTTALERWWHLMVKRLRLERDNLSLQGAGYIIRRIAYAWDVSKAKFVVKLKHLIRPGHTNPTPLPQQYIFEMISTENKKAMARYRPQPYGGHVLLFRASKQLGGILADEYLGWKDTFYGKLDVCEIDAHQQNMMLEPTVRNLARELTIRLNAAQAAE